MTRYIQNILLFALPVVLLPAGSRAFQGGSLPPPSDAYVMRTWTIPDGLPQSSVGCILQTRDGALVRIDSADGIAATMINSIAEDNEGRIWFGTNEGVFVLSGDRFLQFTAPDVARRAGVATMLLGSIVQKEPSLAITTRLIEVKSGKILGSQRVTGFSTRHIFSLVDTLALLVRNDLDLSPTAASDVKLVAEVTTTSVEAYRAYVEGIDLRFKIYLRESLAALTRAEQRIKGRSISVGIFSQQVSSGSMLFSDNGTGKPNSIFRCAEHDHPS